MAANGRATDAFVYFGTFAEGDGRGLYLSRLDGQTGQLTPTSQLLRVPAPVDVKFVSLAPKP